jgi:hypothetical protein
MPCLSLNSFSEVKEELAAPPHYSPSYEHANLITWSCIQFYDFELPLE